MGYHFGIIGNPVAHSLSPILQTHLMGIAEIEGIYEKILVENENQLGRVVQRIRLGELNGINITAPWKTAIGVYLDELSEPVKRLGALNTVKAVNSTLTGYNTDVFGFTQSLKRIYQDEIPLENVVLVGAGGSARAIVLGLEQLKCPEFTILNRTVDNAEDLVESIGFAGEIRIDELTKPRLKASLKTSSLFINTLPPSARKIFQRLQFPLVSGEQVYYDLVYDPKELNLIRKASEAGWRTLDGLDMLIYQGIEAMELWLDRSLRGKVDFGTLYQQLDSTR